MRQVPALGLLLIALGCTFPTIRLLPASPKATQPDQACQTQDGLWLALKFRSWNYTGLLFEVEARNMGSQPQLIDPTTFQCLAKAPSGASLRRPGRDPRARDLGPGLEGLLDREGLQKHTLLPGQGIRGLVCFQLDRYEDAAFRTICISSVMAARSFAFQFQKALPDM